MGFGKCILLDFTRNVVVVFENYHIEKLIGYGTSSLIFQGLDLSCNAAGVPKKVALKFVWDVVCAREEVVRLEKARSVFEICDLITYTEMNGRDVHSVVGHFLDRVRDEFDLFISFESAGDVGILVLKLARGRHLVERSLYKGEPLDGGHEWLVVSTLQDGSNLTLKEFFRPFVRTFTINQRLDILIQLTRAIAESHAIGVTHGDLNPWNIFYNTRNKRITILDLGRDHFGVRGWQAPEHIKLMAGDISVLPRETDLYLLGKWIHRLLPERGPCSHWSQQCLNPIAENRPSAEHLLKVLEKVRHPKQSTSKWAFAIVIGVLFFSGLMFLGKAETFQLSNDHFDRIGVLPFSGAPAGLMIAEMVNGSLDAAPSLAAIHFSKTKALWRENTLSSGDSHAFKRAGDALGGRFFLGGSVTEKANGHMSWDGWLCERNGVCRDVTAQGVSYLDLSDAIVKSTLSLLGISGEETPVGDIYSNIYRANVLYSEGSQLLMNGEVNAALTLLEKAVDDYDPGFVWARLHIADCLYLKGRLNASIELLEQLAEDPLVTNSARASLACYRKLAWAYIGKLDLETATRYLEYASDIGKTREREHFKADQLMISGAIFMTAQNFEKSLPLLASAGKLYLKDKNHFGYLECLLWESVGFMTLYDFDRAGIALKEAEELSIKYKLPGHHARVLTQKARMRLFSPEQQSQPETLELLEKAREIFVSNGDAYHLMAAQSLIGIYFQRSGNYSRAIDVFTDLAEKARSGGVRLFENRASLLLSSIYIAHEDFVRADHLLSSLLTDPEPLPIRARYKIHSRLWKVIASRGDTKRAHALLAESLSLGRELKDNQAIAYAFNNIGELFEQEKRFEAAHENYLKSLALKVSQKDMDGQLWTHRNLVMLAIKRDQLDEARQQLDILSSWKANGFKTKLLKARYLYATGAYQEAFQLLDVCRQEGLEKGRWQNKMEEMHGIFLRSSRRGQAFEVPEFFGNWY